MENILFNRRWSAFEIATHHVLTICCFALALRSGKYVGYALFSELAEINNIFLHCRRLMNYRKKKSILLYKSMLLLNYGTFVIFRFGLFTWMLWWIIRSKPFIPTSHFKLGYNGLLFMQLLNTVLIVRLLRSDVVILQKFRQEL
ncbi:hypothetical protein GJ496_009187 [Pomphorhynchus laevis]|nr:hypothetical protein GJ496_009187 [Pomphorhynchus laevis]